jgi:hypothetical protein
MTVSVAVVPEPTADSRWREWQVRGAESDRKSAAAARIVFALIGTGLVIWLLVQLM